MYHGFHYNIVTVQAREEEQKISIATNLVFCKNKDGKNQKAKISVT